MFLFDLSRDTEGYASSENHTTSGTTNKHPKVLRGESDPSREISEMESCRFAQFAASRLQNVPR